MNRTVVWVGALVVVPLLVVLALAFGKDPRAIDSPLVGQPAPAFALTGIDGEPVSLEALAGRPAVINFWATWCLPCIDEHPVLVEFSRRYAGRASFVGVIYQDEPGAIARFLAERGRWGPALVDPGGRTAIAYGVYGAPETFFVDSGGVVRRKVTGGMSPAALTVYLEELL